MNERVRELAEQANIRFGRMAILDSDPRGMARFVSYSEFEKFAELIVQDYANKTIQALMCDPAFVQAMDEYYERKWAHRFD